GPYGQSGRTRLREKRPRRDRETRGSVERGGVVEDPMTSAYQIRNPNDEGRRNDKAPNPNRSPRNWFWTSTFGLPSAFGFRHSDFDSIGLEMKAAFSRVIGGYTYVQPSKEDRPRHWRGLRHWRGNRGNVRAR